MLIYRKFRNVAEWKVMRTVNWTPAAEGWDGLVTCCI